MSIVVFYDRKTGDILKVDPHPEWGQRELILNYYRRNPGLWPKGAGALTVPEEIPWDGTPNNWIVIQDSTGNPRLMLREEYEIECEIREKREELLLGLVLDKLSDTAQKKAQRSLLDQ